MILYGAGGHAHVVCESLKTSGKTIKGVIDDNQKLELFEGLNICHLYSPEYMKGEELIIAIGSNNTRYDLSKSVQHSLGLCVDGSSIVSRSAMIGSGSMIMARSVIQAGSKLGDHVIINTGAIVDHDCEIQDFAHIGPGGVICGGAYVGRGVLVGANATVLPGLKIGDWATIGAGSVVTKDIEAYEKVAGNPAKAISGE